MLFIQARQEANDGEYTYISFEIPPPIYLFQQTEWEIFCDNRLCDSVLTYVVIISALFSGKYSLCNAFIPPFFCFIEVLTGSIFS